MDRRRVFGAAAKFAVRAREYQEVMDEWERRQRAGETMTIFRSEADELSSETENDRRTVEPNSDALRAIGQHRKKDREQRNVMTDCLVMASLCWSVSAIFSAPTFVSSELSSRDLPKSKRYEVTRPARLGTASAKPVLAVEQTVQSNIVPQGIWHRLLVDEPCRYLYFGGGRAEIRLPV